MSGDSSLSDAIDGLASNPVYVAKDVQGNVELEQTLAAEVDGTNIAVVVVSDDVLLGSTPLSPTEFMGRLAEANPGYDSIVLSIDGELYARSDVVPTNDAMTIARQSSGTQEQALVATIDGIEEITPAGGGSGGFDGVALGLAIGGAVLVAAIATPIIIVRRRLKRLRKPAPVVGGVPQSIIDDVAALRSFVPAYVAVGTSGRGVAAQAARDIDALATNVGELFTRLGRRGDAGANSIAAVEYDAKLRKLSAALHPDYLLDIVRNPHLWDDPNERIDEVQRALTAVSDELLQNIKQVNADRALQFQVSLDGLIGARKELQDWDRDFRDASGS